MELVKRMQNRKMDLQDAVTNRSPPLSSPFKASSRRANNDILEAEVDDSENDLRLVDEEESPLKKSKRSENDLLFRSRPQSSLSESAPSSSSLNNDDASVSLKQHWVTGRGWIPVNSPEAEERVVHSEPSPAATPLPALDQPLEEEILKSPFPPLENTSVSFSDLAESGVCSSCQDNNPLKRDQIGGFFFHINVLYE